MLVNGEPKFWCGCAYSHAQVHTLQARKEDRPRGQAHHGLYDHGSLYVLPFRF